MLSNAKTRSKCGFNEPGDSASTIDSSALRCVYAVFSSASSAVIDVPAVGVKWSELVIDERTLFATPHRSVAAAGDLDAALAPDTTVPSSVSASRNGTTFMEPPLRPLTSTLPPSDCQSFLSGTQRTLAGP